MRIVFGVGFVGWDEDDLASEFDYVGVGRKRLPVF